MRLNGKKVMEIMAEKNLTAETVCSRTGLFEKSFHWIIENGNASINAMERIADSIGVTVGGDRAAGHFRECRKRHRVFKGQ